jgi:putative membrane protein
VLAVLTLFACVSVLAQAPSDPQIAQIVQTANKIDIDHARLALKKSKKQQVKDFANQMISDHTNLEKSVADLSKKLNVTPQESDTSSSCSNKLRTRRRSCGPYRAMHSIANTCRMRWPSTRR